MTAITECERRLAKANARIILLRATLMETRRLTREMQKDMDFLVKANNQKVDKETEI